MKKHFYLLLVVSLIFWGCQPTIVKDYAIIIKPAGPSDVTRNTFFISVKKTDFKRDNPFIYEILTDENTMRNLASFIEDNCPDKNNSTNIEGWGSLEISTYNAKHLMINYTLINGKLSKNYLRQLIKKLESERSDEKLIKHIREDGLSQI